MSSEGEPEKKRDIRALLSVVPPAEALRRQKSPPRERRVRLKYNPAVKPGNLHINPGLLKELPIGEYAEISVHGRRIRLKVVVDEGIPPGEVWGPPDLKSHGIADNSIVTLRPAVGQG